jgi:hypothetical protein
MLAKNCGDEDQYIYVENRSISVTGIKPIKTNYKVTGSQSHNDFMDFQKGFNPLMVRLQTIVPVINSTPYGPQRDSMMQIYHNIQDSIQKNIDIYINQHLSSFVSPFVLFVTTQFYEDPMLLEQRFLRLDSAVRSIPTSISLKHYIEYNKVGAVAPMHWISLSLIHRVRKYHCRHSRENMCWLIFGPVGADLADGKSECCCQLQ